MTLAKQSLADAQSSETFNEGLHCVQVPGKPTRSICDVPANLFQKATRFFLLLASGPRATRLEVHQVFLEVNKRTLASVAKLCDSQTLIESRDRDKHPPYICTRVSNPSSFSIIYGPAIIHVYSFKMFKLYRRVGRWPGHMYVPKRSGQL